MDSHAFARRFVLAVVIGLTIGSAAVPVYAQDADGSRQDLEETEERASELEQRAADAEQELAAADAAVREFEEELDRASEVLLDAQEQEQRAEEDVAVARAQADRAERQLARSEAALGDNEDRLGDLARDTYKYGASRTSVVGIVGSLTHADGPADAADALAYLERGLGDWTGLVEEARTLVVQVEVMAERAEEQRREEEGALADAAAARNLAAEAHARASELASQASVAQRQQLEALAQIEEDRSRAEERIGQLESEIEAAERRQAEERRQAAARPAPARSSPGSGLVTIQGITVAAEIGPALDALLDAARDDGIVLGGSGWRSPESQAQLRRANGCPDVHDSPASSCRVPTARPGSSEHEKGLAIDFTWQARTICYPLRSSACNDNAAFDWLQRNAVQFGFQNLPSEAWHWSTTGR
ncbi:hypothetical protein FTX61_19705 [Nitriliruptoraceae bacterium ZYF776]|nr:hypothetical protein [Profundirhabdus halotolerans]